VRDALQDERFRDNPLVTGAPDIRFYAGQPIHGPDGSRVGTLCLIDRQPREFDADDASVLADLAAMVDRELALLDRAATDELTSLSNRRGFATVAQQVLALCRRNQQPAVVVGIDLDNFKSINDDFGHEAGDRALRIFAKLLGSTFRESDVVARLGGDEFAVLCSATTAVNLTGSLERLANAFAASPLARDYPKLSWSYGLAEYRPDSGAAVDDLLRAADACMYDAKVEARRTRQQR
jgi:diguanylate cyclase (GGDEF)-like protein